MDEDLRRGVRAILSGAAVGLDKETIRDLIRALNRAAGVRFQVEQEALCKSVLNCEPFWLCSREGFAMHLVLETTWTEGSQMVGLRFGCSKKTHESGEYVAAELGRGPRLQRHDCKRCLERADRLEIQRDLGSGA